MIGNLGIDLVEQRKLKAIYLSLNPALLKREIEDKIGKLYQPYEGKRKTQIIKPLKKTKTKSRYLPNRQEFLLTIRLPF